MFTINKYTSLQKLPDYTSKELAIVFKQYNPKKYDKAERIAELYIKWGNKFGIKPILSFPQMIHETGYLTYKGIVPESANNFAGIGATGASGVYNIFATEELGVIAHLIHLAWYIYQNHLEIKDEQGDLYCSTKYDPRHFGNIHKFNVSNLEQLGGKWAVPGTTYGTAIARIAQNIIDTNQLNNNDDKPEYDNFKNEFDLIIQMGHIGRTKGATGARNEQKFTEALGKALYKKFENSKLNIRLMGADNWLQPKPNQCKLFFSIHYDGSTNISARGSSVGYPVNSNPIFAHTIHNAYTKLSEFPQRRDNYTSGLINYYAWRNKHVLAKYYCLLEHGFGTNNYEYNWMFANIEKIAECHYKTIIEFYELFI